MCEEFKLELPDGWIPSILGFIGSDTPGTAERGQLWIDTSDEEQHIVKAFCCASWHAERSGEYIVCGCCGRLWPVGDVRI